MSKNTRTLAIWFIVLSFMVILTFVAIFATGIGATLVQNAPFEFGQRDVTAHAETRDARDLSGRVIILDPGHGLGNTNIFEGYDEQVRMLALALRIRPRLEELGATVHMTRPDPTDVMLPVRTALINRWALEAIRELRHDQREIDEIDRLIRIMQRVIDDPETYAGIYFNFPFDMSFTREIHPDLRRIFQLQEEQAIRDNFLMISLHSNATPRPIDTRINGADSFFISNNQWQTASYYTEYINVERSYFFANLIITNIEPLGIRRNRAQARNFFMIREHNVPGVLVENGFHTNPLDRARLQNDDFLDRLAVVYVETIVQYFASFDRVPDRPFDALDDVFALNRLF